ncbi:MAG: DNA cytosine methyltransferase [Dokdonella sp.]
MVDSNKTKREDNSLHLELKQSGAGQGLARPLTTIDLFCGAGGITEGFKQAGCQSLFGNDMMPEAIETFRRNHPGVMAECRPIEEVSARDVRTKLGLEREELDVLVGGPPCQGFSINAPERFLDDPRNKLFKQYEKFLCEFRPKTFLFENVPGLLSLDDGRVFRQIFEIFEKLGYNLSAKILFSAHYGVPQERWRLILLGSLGGALRHPAPTHYATGFANFRGGRTLTFSLDERDKYLLAQAVTVGDAIDDLPRLDMGEGAETMGYTVDAHSAYAAAMRGTGDVVFNHYAGKLAKQNLERMKYVKPGGSWRDIPHHLLPKGMQNARKSDHTKRYGRLHRDGLSGTVLTKCDPHWGTVFLPDQDRALTVREAARFQSFPDSYRFLGSRVSQYEQVGNAVPVLVARAIAEEVRLHLNSGQSSIDTIRGGRDCLLV